jgi:hypothetical protein
MVDSARIREFWGHWQREPNPTVEFKRFRTRVYEVARQLWGTYFQKSTSLREKFAVVSGTPTVSHPYFDQSGLANLLSQAKDEFEVAEAIQYLLWTVEGGLSVSTTIVAFSFSVPSRSALQS